MMNSPVIDLSSQLAKYDFHLPPELIAQKRDSANNRLLIVDCTNRELIVSKTSLLDKHLPRSVSLFYNATLVLPARHLFQTAAGRAHEVLFIDQDYEDLPLVKAKVRNLSKLKEGDEIFCGEFKFVLTGRDNQLAILKIPFLTKNELFRFYREHGLAPSPPYMKQVEDAKIYQNPLGDLEESIAAPTSCYHFTPELIEKIGKDRFHKLYLRVGLGTFEPIQTFEKLHEEKFVIPESTRNAWNSTEECDRCIVGTTAFRTLESSLRLNSFEGKTTLFLNEDNPPKLKFEYLLTNFHLPKSSLFILICSLIGKEMAFEAYSKAIRERFKFFSFGDAMLIRRRIN